MSMAPDSNSAKSSSTNAGMRPLGLSFTYQSDFCSLVAKSMTLTSYGKPISSSAIEIFQPFGVGAVYSVIDIIGLPAACSDGALVRSAPAVYFRTRRPVGRGIGNPCQRQRLLH